MDMRAFIIILIAITVSLTWQSNSLALDTGLSSMKYRFNKQKQSCTDQKWRLGYKESLLDDVEKLKNFIEQVPPDERKYLEAEM